MDPTAAQILPFGDKALAYLSPAPGRRSSSCMASAATRRIGLASPLSCPKPTRCSRSTCWALAARRRPETIFDARASQGDQGFARRA